MENLTLPSNDAFYFVLSITPWCSNNTKVQDYMLKICRFQGFSPHTPQSISVLTLRWPTVQITLFKINPFQWQQLMSSLNENDMRFKMHVPASAALRMHQWLFTHYYLTAHPAHLEAWKSFPSFSMTGH